MRLFLRHQKTPVDFSLPDTARSELQVFHGIGENRQGDMPPPTGEDVGCLIEALIRSEHNWQSVVPDSLGWGRLHCSQAQRPAGFGSGVCLCTPRHYAVPTFLSRNTSSLVNPSGDPKQVR